MHHGYNWKVDNTESSCDYLAYMEQNTNKEESELLVHVVGLYLDCICHCLEFSGRVPVIQDLDKQHVLFTCSIRLYSAPDPQLYEHRRVNRVQSLLYHRAANCPGFAGTIPDFEPCPGCPGKRLNVPDSRGLNFKRKPTKIVIKLAKIHVS